MTNQELNFPEWIEVFAKGRWTDAEENPGLIRLYQRDIAKRR